ncbi:MAG: LysM peptidoglycan-binding domain-containing protein, partial [Dokdonella sp.]|nr:LysM peptidoglycan-binding domain-containing protein [Dokdonella sp.]MCC6440593.1 LysM peptidoglycan-binding domain-containing protein [Rhodanobacteraceae bacterium]
QDPATHVVQQGDSLWRLAQSHGVSVKQLREWNGLHPGSILKLGMRLLIRAPEY